jgi:hypothetical protein
MINIYLGLDFKIPRMLEPTVTLSQDVIYMGPKKDISGLLRHNTSPAQT